ncbi:NAD+ synthase [Lipingzhangella sp. LS1_29]|uniref:Glutamine-dependent NAD(+) synthetase n=1 Tax=Lipingzhangella rawalii TaxID=2055835 RepID=A0ABU2H2K1_9ACTN|nr:NAD+ synthase [Lipingzhangella rawalii]MDS1269523.1 NAD+ synthase [Lipingzhangella rawalii]
MARLTIALAQINTVVGDLEGNSQRILAEARRAQQAQADAVVFPEMTLTGYPVEDLALRSSFAAASQTELERLAVRLSEAGQGELPVVVGFLEPGTGRPRNALAVLWQGVVRLVSAKHHLPNYGVFDEHRYFVPGDVFPVVTIGGVDVAFAICEDLWQDGGPVAAVRQAGAGLLVVLNGSPYERDKDDVRLELCRRRAREAGAALAYVNLVGGQDELVFDGDSLVVDATGEVMARAAQFTEELLVCDLELPSAATASPPPQREIAADGITIQRDALSATVRTGAESPAGAARHAARLTDPAEIYAALVAGTRDYVRKNGFPSVLLGLSGGIDSALTATIAADALGSEAVHAVLMPSRYSSGHSVSDAEDLVKRQGIHGRTVPVAGLVQAYEGELDLDGLAAENLQARVRGVVVMSLSNQEGHLVLAPGNKSELATGYSTLYGDSVGGYAPIKDIWKTQVWELARWRNAEAERHGETPPIPENSIVKEPSAELRPDQRDTDSLPDYAVLDALLDDYVGTDLGRGELVAAGHDAQLVDRVIRMVDRAEYKRRQYPPGPKVSRRNFGRDRRLPITNRWSFGVGLPPLCRRGPCIPEYSGMHGHTSLRWGEGSRTDDQVLFCAHDRKILHILRGLCNRCL